MSSLAAHRRGSVLILLLLSIITIAVVIAFAFLRTMQMSRGITLVQRKDDLARLAAEMGMQHALAVCIDEYAMPDERRDDQTMTPVARLDAPSQLAFAALSRVSPTDTRMRPPQPYDLGADGAFNDLFDSFAQGTVGERGVGFGYGAVTKSGYARWFEANRFTYAGRTTFDPTTYDAYDADVAVPDPSVVTTRFPPVDPFVRGAALTQRHAGDNPLLLDADLRPVLDVRDARYRLRYAIDVQHQAGNLWLNTEMPWIAPANLATVRRGHAESIYAVGMQLGGEGRGHGFASVFLGYGAVGNSAFANGLAKDWPTRGGQTMYYRDSSSDANRAFHSVHGNAFMTWNDPLGQWIGSAIGSFNDLSFATQGDDERWHTQSEGGNIRNDSIGQFMVTPFGRPEGAGTDHPWAINALTLSPRTLEALVAAYMPPAVRTVRVTHEMCFPWIQKGTDAANNPVYGWGDAVEWEIPAEAELTVPGIGPDLLSANFEPKAGFFPFISHPAPPKRNYWHTPTLNPADETQGRFSYDSESDLRSNVERYPGPLFFTAATHELEGQARTRWREVAALPRQSETDPANVPIPPEEGVDHLGRHIVFYKAGSAGNGNVNSYLSAAHLPILRDNTNWAYEMVPTLPFSMHIGGPGKDGRLSPYKDSKEIIYEPDNPQATNGEIYPPKDNRWDLADKLLALDTHPTLRGTAPFTGTKAVTTVEGWKIQHRSGSTWENEATAVHVNTYYNRLALACFQAIGVAQQANLAWASHLDSRSTRFSSANETIGVRYTTTPGDTSETSYLRKGVTTWDPKAVDFATVEQLDRQFLANLGESFDLPGHRTPSAASVERPPRYVIWNNDNRGVASASPATLRFASNTRTSEYFVTNNIRTLLTPLDANAAGVLTAMSTDPQSEPPRKLWLLDEWDIGELTGIETNAYVPGTTLDPHPGGTLYRPSHAARVRAMLMERVLNDWRLSFFGSEASYVGSFRPKDFDGDGIVWCSGYAPNAGAPTHPVLVPLFAVDGRWGLPSCWQTADANGNGPAVDTPFSVTGCFTINPNRQFKIHVRGELYDNFLDRAVADQILQGALLVDPDGNVTRGPLGTGLEDSTLMLQRPIHNYYQGLRNRSYP